MNSLLISQELICINLLCLCNVVTTVLPVVLFIVLVFSNLNADCSLAASCKPLSVSSRKAWKFHQALAYSPLFMGT